MAMMTMKTKTTKMATEDNINDNAQSGDKDTNYNDQESNINNDFNDDRGGKKNDDNNENKRWWKQQNKYDFVTLTMLRIMTKHAIKNSFNNNNQTGRNDNDYNIYQDSDNQSENNNDQDCNNDSINNNENNDNNK